MNKEIVFKLKTQGFVSRENGFTLSESAPISTVTKFTDGNWMVKVGRTTVKGRYSSSYKFYKESLENTLGIQL
jgi:hypothetical protein